MVKLQPFGSGPLFQVVKDVVFYGRYGLHLCFQLVEGRGVARRLPEFVCLRPLNAKTNVYLLYYGVCGGVCQGFLERMFDFFGRNFLDCDLGFDFLNWREWGKEKDALRAPDAATL